MVRQKTGSASLHAYDYCTLDTCTLHQWILLQSIVFPHMFQVVQFSCFSGQDAEYNPTVVQRCAFLTHLSNTLIPAVALNNMWLGGLSLSINREKPYQRTQAILRVPYG